MLKIAPQLVLILVSSVVMLQRAYNSYWIHQKRVKYARPKATGENVNDMYYRLVNGISQPDRTVNQTVNQANHTRCQAPVTHRIQNTTTLCRKLIKRRKNLRKACIQNKSTQLKYVGQCKGHGYWPHGRLV